MRFRAAHVVVAGFVAQCAAAAYFGLVEPPAPAEGPEEGVDALRFGPWLSVAIATVGLAPAFLLWRPATHKVGRWSALLLGWLAVLAVFWAVQGMFLVAAFVVAMWRERARPAEATGLAASAAPPT